MGGRINTIMQTCFFYLSNILPQDEAIAAIKKAIEKTYGKRGEKVVQMNFNAVDQAMAALGEIPVPATAGRDVAKLPVVPEEAPEFVQTVTAAIMAGHGDRLPVSAMPADGVWPTDTTQWEKRNIALEIPVWEPDLCIQCGKCSFHCPHATIRTKVYDPALLAGAPATFKSVDAKGKEYAGLKWTVQVAPEDCTGCGACVHICPGQGQSRPGAQGHQHGLPAPAARDGARQLRVLRGHPLSRSQHGARGQRQGQPAPGTPVRVLGRLRGLRRDALRQASHPALRRPPAHRQRHGLLQHLRGQPAHHALCQECRRTGSHLEQLPFRGRGGVQLRSALGRGQAHRDRQGLRGRHARRRRSGTGGRLPGRQADRRGRDRGPARSGRGTQGKAQSGPGLRREATISAAADCSTPPTTWSRRASGASGATAGPTTSAMAVWTTSWPRDATSTCWY